MPEILSISVIIPTFNGAHKVVRALESLLTQSRKPDEVIVVIDGSTDNTKFIIESRKFDFQQLRIIEQQNGGRAKVRNRGAKEAKSNLLLFMDDDIIAPVDWVKGHFAHHIKFENSILTGKLEDPNIDKSADFLIFKAWLNKRWNKEVALPGNDEIKIEYSYISANNLSIPKLLFEKIGYFDDRLTDAEDYDLAVRANSLGIPLFFGNSTWAWHNDETTCRKYIFRLKEYQNAQQKLIDLKPELHNYNHRYTLKKPLGVKRWFFLLFSLDFWVLCIDRGWLKILPKFIRFRIYDYVTTAKGVYNY